MATAKNSGKKKVKRLTPKSDVLRQLYLLSGNNCAMPGCKNAIIDREGVLIGHVCHIEAAMPDGARFNENQTNEQRRQIENLVLICANHHLQIDSSRYEKVWTLKKVRKLKADHEAKFQAIEGMLEQGFETQFIDSTEALTPTDPGEFAAFEALLPEYGATERSAPKRKKQVTDYIKKMQSVPETERDFMHSVIQRFIRLDTGRDRVSVNAQDLVSAFKMSSNKVKEMGDALKRYGVGDLGEVAIGDRDEWHIEIWDPSHHLSWLEIAEFCDKRGNALSDFVLHLKFGQLEK